jgi:predicted dehydrogenase
LVKLSSSEKGFAMKKIKLAVLGLNFGQHIIDQVTNGPGSKWFELAAVCDLDQKKADETAEKHQVKAYYDLDALLQNPDIPAIGLFTGPVGRAGLIRKIVDAGKDIITTKPFELDPEAALKVLYHAKKLKRVVHLNSPGPLLSPDLEQAKIWIEKYQLGHPIAARIDVWVSYREKADGSWYDNPDQCPVPPVFRLGIYLINDIVRFFGEAESVQVTQSRIFTGRPTSDNGQLSILFKNGAIVNIFASFCINDGNYYANSMIMNYENGTIYRDIGPRISKLSPPVKMSVMSGGNWQDEPKIEEITVSSSAKSGDYQWENFYNAIQGQTLRDEISPEEIVYALKIIKAMSKAQHSLKTEPVF